MPSACLLRLPGCGGHDIGWAPCTGVAVVAFVREFVGWAALVIHLLWTSSFSFFFFQFLSGVQFELDFDSASAAAALQHTALQNNHHPLSWSLAVENKGSCLVNFDAIKRNKTPDERKERKVSPLPPQGVFTHRCRHSAAAPALKSHSMPAACTRAHHLRITSRQGSHGLTRHRTAASTRRLSLSLNTVHRL